MFAPEENVALISASYLRESTTEASEWKESINASPITRRDEIRYMEIRFRIALRIKNKSLISGGEATVGLKQNPQLNRQCNDTDFS